MLSSQRLEWGCMADRCATALTLRSCVVVYGTRNLFGDEWIAGVCDRRGHVDVMVWNKALTDVEVEYLYEVGS